MGRGSTQVEKLAVRSRIVHRFGAHDPEGVTGRSTGGYPLRRDEAGDPQLLYTLDGLTSTATRRCSTMVLS